MLKIIFGILALFLFPFAKNKEEPEEEEDLTWIDEIELYEAATDDK